MDSLKRVPELIQLVKTMKERKIRPQLCQALGWVFPGMLVGFGLIVSVEQEWGSVKGSN